MLGDLTTHVVGVDTHADSHTFSAINSATGAVALTATQPANVDGYLEMISTVDQLAAPDFRAWAIEGTSSYGAGLCSFLRERGELVVEVERPKRPKTRNGSKSDEIDAIRAARDALSLEHPGTPKARGKCESLRVVMATRELEVTTRTALINQLKSFVVTAPEQLRADMRTKTSVSCLVASCQNMENPDDTDHERCTTTAMMKEVAGNIARLDAQIKAHDKIIDQLTSELCP